MLADFESVDEQGPQQSEKEESDRCISFEMFVEFMFRHRFSKGIEDEEMLGLIFALLLNKRVRPERGPKTAISQ